MESVGEAVQTSTMAVRLILAIADAVRRAAEKRAGGEKPLPPAEPAKAEMAGDLKATLPPDIATALISDADWTQMAQQLMALKNAGVDMGELLPRVGEIAVTVRDAVAANEARIAADGAGEWARLLRETMPAGPVREAILSSPTWPDIAATMGRLDVRGVDVREILVAARTEGVGVDQAIARVMAASPPSLAVVQTYGPLSEGLDIPRNLNLEDRPQALLQLAISPAENARFVRVLREAMTPELGKEADLLVNSKQWPLLASRMAAMANDGEPLDQHLARLMSDRTWQKGPSGQLSGRLIQAANNALRTPLGTGGPVAATVPRVSTEAAKAVSTTGPKTGPAPAAAAPAEPAVAPHRTPAAGPGRAAGRSA